MESEKKYRIFNMIFEKMLRDPIKTVDGRRLKWFFFYDESYEAKGDEKPNYINLAEEMRNYPRNVAEKVNRALQNISIKYKSIGDIIDWSQGCERRLLFCDSQNQDSEALSMFNFIRDLGDFDGNPLSGSGRVSYKGWEKIDELNTYQKEINQGFIAMSFSKDAAPIMEIFKSAINESGYKPQVISEKEHNNQIVPEIFFEIGRSKFIVVDITYPNYGAYYEAGFAQALEKQVIVCCRKREFDDNKTKPHFDIAQKAMIIWESENELKESLIKRIQATVN
jgi:nucleoside 2-deoxyribosyltransferase